MMHEKPMTKMTAEQKEYEIEEAARTLKQFAKIRKNKALFAAARAQLQKEIKASQEMLKIK